ncbi:MAG TPA: NAD(P)/FAD-dependent oxidoreductase [Chthoniobacterales bacterium]|jgi:thioredoxin reductase (NADPH)|nr:NAD(P)/FAD-dependent oxidoreductase [Chthoniobacterales bacterium]
MIKPNDLEDPNTREVIVIGGGLAGLSAAIYLGRAQRDTLVIDSGHSMAKWEPIVENYLGFPRGVSGEELLKNGASQARKHDVGFAADEIKTVSRKGAGFILKGKKKTYRTKRLLLATGIFHLPPEIPGVTECLGHSMFFCKDCDGYRVRRKRIAIIGANNEAVEYALGMLHYSARVIVATNGKRVAWDRQHAKWLEEYEIPVASKRITDVDHRRRKIRGLTFVNRDTLKIDYLFTTRGDIFHNQLARKLGARIDEDGEIEIDRCMRTTVPGLYAAGCVTPANCQMIIAAGQGAAAAQAINRDLFEESLASHSLRRFREVQLEKEKTEPEVKPAGRQRRRKRKM